MAARASWGSGRVNAEGPPGLLCGSATAGKLACSGFPCMLLDCRCLRRARRSLLFMFFRFPGSTQGPAPSSEELAVWCTFRGLAIDDLRDAQGLEAFGAELEAVAGLLGSAEGDAGVHGAVLVDPHGSGLDAGGDLSRRTHIGGPD
jgi:hypothetical protein